MGSTPGTLPRLGRYQDLRLLGQGGMGAVYRATDPLLGRDVAIKIVLHSTDELIARFRREAQAIARLQHPHIVQLFDFGVGDGGDPYFVMELLSGTPLDRRLQVGGRVAPAVALSLARQAADGLAAAHRAGIVHRDVKPSNMIVDERGHLKLVDFGVARFTEGSPLLTGITALLGTPGYMAPEQATGSHVDQRADIYSLGLTLFEMLVGEPPYRGDNPLAVVLRQVQEPVPDLRRTGLGLPEALVQLVEHMTARVPDGRFPCCEELIIAIDQLAGPLAAAAEERLIAGAAAPDRPELSDTPLLDRRAIGPLAAPPRSTWLRESPSADEFRRVIAGRWYATSTTLLWCTSPTLCGAAIWGRPAADDTRQTVYCFGAMDQLAPRFDIMFDASAIDDIDPESLVVLLDWARPLQAELGRRVRRRVGIVPATVHGFTLAGVMPMLGGGAMQMAPDARTAMRMLLSDGADALCEEVDEITRRLRDKR